MISVRLEERQKKCEFYGLAAAIDSESWTIMFVVTWTWNLMKSVGVCLCVCVVGLLVMTAIACIE